MRRVCESHGDLDGDTALHFAAAAGRHALVFGYLSQATSGSTHDVDKANKAGWTALMQAARNGHTPCVRTLLQYGADVNRRNAFGACSLSLAAASGNLDTVRLLANTVFSNGQRSPTQPISPLVFAILFNYVDILCYLTERFELHTPTEIGGLSPLTIAAVINNKEIMELLKRRGVDPIKLMTSISGLSNSSNVQRRGAPSPLLLVTSGNDDQTSVLRTMPSPLSLQHSAFLSPRARKCSALSVGLSPHLCPPDVSPILFPDTPNPFFHSCSSSFSVSQAMSASPVNEYLNTRFSMSPVFFSDSIPPGEPSLFGDIRKSNAKVRSRSQYSVREEGNAGTDDVFADGVTATATDPCRKFAALLRRHSLDSCVSLFQKHEVDLDVFLTLTRRDLEEIGIDWDKRDDVLEVIYQLNQV